MKATNPKALIGLLILLFAHLASPAIEGRCVVEDAKVSHDEEGNVIIEAVQVAFYHPSLPQQPKVVTFSPNGPSDLRGTFYISLYDKEGNTIVQNVQGRNKPPEKVFAFGRTDVEVNIALAGPLNDKESGQLLGCVNSMSTSLTLPPPHDCVLAPETDVDQPETECDCVADVFKRCANSCLSLINACGELVEGAARTCPCSTRPEDGDATPVDLLAGGTPAEIGNTPMSPGNTVPADAQDPSQPDGAAEEQLAAAQQPANETRPEAIDHPTGSSEENRFPLLTTFMEREGIPRKWSEGKFEQLIGGMSEKLDQRCLSACQQLRMEAMKLGVDAAHALDHVPQNLTQARNELTLFFNDKLAKSKLDCARDIRLMVSSVMQSLAPAPPTADVCDLPHPTRTYEQCGMTFVERVQDNGDRIIGFQHEGVEHFIRRVDVRGKLIRGYDFICEEDFKRSCDGLSTEDCNKAWEAYRNNYAFESPKIEKTSNGYHTVDLRPVRNAFKACQEREDPVMCTHYQQRLRRFTESVQRKFGTTLSQLFNEEDSPEQHARFSTSAQVLATAIDHALRPIEPNSPLDNMLKQDLYATHKVRRLGSLSDASSFQLVIQAERGHLHIESDIGGRGTDKVVIPLAFNREESVPGRLVGPVFYNKEMLLPTAFVSEELPDEVVYPGQTANGNGVAFEKGRFTRVRQERTILGNMWKLAVGMIIAPFEYLDKSALFSWSRGLHREMDRQLSALDGTGLDMLVRPDRLPFTPTGSMKLLRDLRTNMNAAVDPMTLSTFETQALNNYERSLGTQFCLNKAGLSLEEQAKMADERFNTPEEIERFKQAFSPIMQVEALVRYIATQSHREVRKQCFGHEAPMQCMKQSLHQQLLPYVNHLSEDDKKLFTSCEKDDKLNPLGYLKCARAVLRGLIEEEGKGKIPFKDETIGKYLAWASMINPPAEHAATLANLTDYNITIESLSDVGKIETYEEALSGAHYLTESFVEMTREEIAASAPLTLAAVGTGLGLNQWLCHAVRTQRITAAAAIKMRNAVIKAGMTAGAIASVPLLEEFRAAATTNDLHRGIMAAFGVGTMLAMTLVDWYDLASCPKAPPVTPGEQFKIVLSDDGKPKVYHHQGQITPQTRYILDQALGRHESYVPTPAEAGGIPFFHQGVHYAKGRPQVAGKTKTTTLASDPGVAEAIIRVREAMAGAESGAQTATGAAHVELPNSVCREKATVENSATRTGEAGAQAESPVASTNRPSSGDEAQGGGGGSRGDGGDAGDGSDGQSGGRGGEDDAGGGIPPGDRDGGAGGAGGDGDGPRRGTPNLMFGDDGSNAHQPHIRARKVLESAREKINAQDRSGGPRNPEIVKNGEAFMAYIKELMEHLQVIRNEGSNPEAIHSFVTLHPERDVKGQPAPGNLVVQVRDPRGDYAIVVNLGWDPSENRQHFAYYWRDVVVEETLLHDLVAFPKKDLVSPSSTWYYAREVLPRLSLDKKAAKVISPARDLSQVAPAGQEHVVLGFPKEYGIENTEGVYRISVPDKEIIFQYPLVLGEVDLNGQLAASFNLPDNTPPATPKSPYKPDVHGDLPASTVREGGSSREVSQSRSPATDHTPENPKNQESTSGETASKAGCQADKPDILRQENRWRIKWSTAKAALDKLEEALFKSVRLMMKESSKQSGADKLSRSQLVKKRQEFITTARQIEEVIAFYKAAVEQLNDLIKQSPDKVRYTGNLRHFNPDLNEFGEPMPISMVDYNDHYAVTPRINFDDPAQVKVMAAQESAAVLETKIIIPISKDLTLPQIRELVMELQITRTAEFPIKSQLAKDANLLLIDNHGFRIQKTEAGPQKRRRKSNQCQ